MELKTDQKMMTLSKPVQLPSRNPNEKALKNEKGLEEKKKEISLADKLKKYKRPYLETHL